MNWHQNESEPLTLDVKHASYRTPISHFCSQHPEHLTWFYLCVLFNTNGCEQPPLIALPTSWLCDFFNMISQQVHWGTMRSPICLLRLVLSGGIRVWLSNRNYPRSHYVIQGILELVETLRCKPWHPAYFVKIMFVFFFFTILLGSCQQNFRSGFSHFINPWHNTWISYATFL